MTTPITFTQLWQQLTPLHEPREAQALVRTLLEDLWGFTLTDLCTGALERLSEEQSAQLQNYLQQLAAGCPVQYVTGRAWMGGQFWSVQPGVLIPRPETGELIEQVSQWLSQQPPPHRLLDVGTGSGCIAVSLALRFPQAEVEAWDVEPVALQTARNNAQRLGASITVKQQDALLPPQHFERWDAVVSNPPYIPLNEREQMAPWVTDYEPERALFVPTDQPLLFYEALSRYAITALRPGGLLAVECHEDFAQKVADYLKDNGWDAPELHIDLFQRPRMVLATKPLNA